MIKVSKKWIHYNGILTALGEVDGDGDGKWLGGNDGADVGDFVVLSNAAFIGHFVGFYKP